MFILSSFIFLYSHKEEICKQKMEEKFVSEIERTFDKKVKEKKLMN